MGASGNDRGISMRVSRMAFVCALMGIPLASASGSVILEAASVAAFTIACATMYESNGRRMRDALGSIASASLLVCAAGTEGDTSTILISAHWLSLLAALRVATLRVDTNVPQQECEGGSTNGIPAV